jgi:hypothetical protein
MAAGRKAISKAMRQQVYDSLNGHCGYCGCKITIKEMQIDHIEAVYLHEKELKAGKAQEINSIENYMPACRMCNFYKSTMSIESFRKQLETLPERLDKIFIYRLAKKYGIVKENGEKSIIQIMRYMQLTEEEMLAIRWHMGAFDSAVKGGSYDMNNAFAGSRLAAMLHIADMMATHFDERTNANE